MLASTGAHVIAADVRLDAAERISERAIEGDGWIAPMQLDVANAAQDKSAIESIVREHGRLDILVNNAGIDRTVSVEELTVEEWDKIMAVNLRGPFVLSRAAFSAMKEQGGGHIVNIASTASLRAWANAAAYHTSKAGLLALSDALHVEGRPHHIKVTAVIAGGMRTPFLLDRFEGIDQSLLQEPKAVARVVQSVLTQPGGSVVPQVMVLPELETSWP
jgi:NAD(P)-dependent dehydrogenase (short-subunit alcohol dehydrogenase family)